MSQENNGNIEIIEVLVSLKRYIAQILLCGLVLGICGFAYTKMFITPMYQASGKMIVNTREIQSENVTSDQVSSAQEMLEAYAVVIKSRTVLSKVIDNLDLDMDYSELASKVNIESVSGTQIMEISVTDANVKQASKIAKEILKISPEIIAKTTKIGSLNVVEEVYANRSPVSPNVAKNTIISILVGCLIPSAIVVVAMMFENTYKSDIDIKNDLDLPVLGIIPNVCDLEAKKGKKTSAR